jgi:quinol monooxygenase YgiN
MAEPFIFIGTHRVREGKLEAFQRWFADFIADVVEPNEPRLLSFQAYVDPAVNEVSVVQVHPDAESMMSHMSLIPQHVGAAYGVYLEHESTWQIYGIPRGGVLEMVQQLAGDATKSLTVKEPFAGFTRLPDL